MVQTIRRQIYNLQIETAGSDAQSDQRAIWVAQGLRLALGIMETAKEDSLPDLKPLADGEEEYGED